MGVVLQSNFEIGCCFSLQCTTPCQVVPCCDWNNACFAIIVLQSNPENSASCEIRIAKQLLFCNPKKIVTSLPPLKMADSLLLQFSCRARWDTRPRSFLLIDRFHVLTAAFHVNFRMQVSFRCKMQLHFLCHQEWLAALNLFFYARILDIIDSINPIFRLSKYPCEC